MFNSFEEDMVVTEMVGSSRESSLYIDPTPIPDGSSPLLRSGRFSNIVCPSSSYFVYIIQL